jgi:hypothetical protein
MPSFELNIIYSQLAVFNSNLDDPFNDWSKAHVSQGFSWREGSVSFKTIESDGVVHVDFEVKEQFVLDPNSIRAISVPFQCIGGEIEIAAIAESQPLPLADGSYQLIFECGSQPENWCRITMISDGDLEPRILVADQVISPNYPLVMGAPIA